MNDGRISAGTVHRSALKASAPELERLREARPRSLLAVATQPWLSTFLLLTTDFAAMAIANVSAVWLRLAFDGHFTLNLYLHLWPLIGLFVVVFYAYNLYSSLTPTPAEELKRIAHACSISFLLPAAATFLTRGAEDYSRGVLIMAWLMSIAIVPMMRASLRRMVCRRNWWGHPVVVLGAGDTAESVVAMLIKRPAFGLKPIAMLDDDVAKHGSLIHGVPVLGELGLATRIASEFKVSHAILAMPGAPLARLRELEVQNQRHFPHLMVVPNLCGFASLWVVPRDLGGILGLEVRRNLLLPGPQLLKRTMELSLCVIGGVLALPLVILFGLAIKLESRGPVFFAQERIGRDNTRFRAWKFRSMVQDANQRLAEYLERHPELRPEWDRDHKLRDDPRLTRVGRFLRKTSLDELPQILNVLRGEMSLVGPRPIVDAEVKRYGDDFDLFNQVRPGITGLWQVSGRNDVTYEERVALDCYYVRNWSVWLDVFILAKTVRVVVAGKGAY